MSYKTDLQLTAENQLFMCLKVSGEHSAICHPRIYFICIVTSLSGFIIFGLVLGNE